VLHPKPWWNRVKLNLSRENVFGFCLVFAFTFLMFRFDFPDFRSSHMLGTTTSALISTLIACFVLFRKDRPKSKSTTLTISKAENYLLWESLALAAAVELVIALTLYAMFTYVSMTVGIVLALGAWPLIQLDILDPLRTKSLWSRLILMTSVTGAFFFIGWKITGQDIWLRLLLVGSVLSGGLVFIDRWEASK